MKRLWSSLNIAFSIYSRLPAAQCDWSEENTKYVMCFFPWIGAVIGLLCSGWKLLAAWLGVGAPLRTAVLILISVAVSGGIHLDGLLDTADALSSWQSREKRLEILKDSHAGAFAIITCVLYFLLLYCVLWDIQPVFLVYVFTFVVSRSLSAFSVVTFPKATPDGTVAGFAKNARTRVIQATVLSYVAVCAIAMLCIQPACGAAALLGAFLTFAWYHHMALKKFGGINGDLAGCFVCACELAMPLAAVVGRLVVSKVF